MSHLCERVHVFSEIVTFDEHHDVGAKSILI